MVDTKSIEVVFENGFLKNEGGSPEGLHIGESQEGYAISLSPHCRATLVEHYVGETESEQGVHTITLGVGATVNHIQLFHEEFHARHVSTLQVQQSEKSCFTSWMLSLGSAWVRQELTVYLEGEGARCTLNGLYCVGAEEEKTHHTRIFHKAPHCESKEVYKGIVGKRGKANFSGKIIVEENAIKSQASLVNKNLMLSSESEVNTKPELEILNEDVNCTHGATVGQLDEQALFYFRSRGIEAKAAKELLVSAFVNEGMGDIPPFLFPLVEKKIKNLSRLAA